jgi:hypothetical protein
VEVAKEDKEDGTARSSESREREELPSLLRVLSRAVLRLALLHWLTGEALVVRVGR